LWAVKIAVVLPLPQLGVEQADDGHSGLRTDEIRNRLHNWLAGNANDRALVHVAANNVLQGTSITAAGDKLSSQRSLEAFPPRISGSFGKWGNQPGRFIVWF